MGCVGQDAAFDRARGSLCSATLSLLECSPVLVVDPRGSSPVALRVGPGMYHEFLECIAQGVTITGQGPDSTSIINAEPRPTCILADDNVRLSGVTLQQDSRDFPCLRLDGGALAVSDCCISAANCSAVLIRSGHPTVRGCAIQGSKQHGVHVRKYGCPLLEGNQIAQNGQFGVLVEPCAEVTLRDNLIHQNGRNGIYLEPKALAIIKANHITSNTDCNIDVGAGADATILENKIEQAGKCGVCFAEYARGVLQANTVIGSAWSNVVVMRGANVTVRWNSIHGSAQHGVYVHPGASATVQDNHIHSNNLNNLKIEERAIMDRSTNDRPIAKQEAQ
uniref:Right handed beta helix domain-containing protein n=1 Tax=Eutreptiella gymnastica TaxID=73025 RepID=A0A7S1HTG4_9EUGL|mmetsp:Transcript_104625/g.180327  ORF Transcript_104625/g.180327 Transcript_104625/m.180327 type:complete len:335 (+) Transcript_104625:60-1064(+)